jgi:hypothetical protein
MWTFVYNLPIDPTTLAGNIYINSGPATPYTLSLRCAKHRSHDAHHAVDCLHVVRLLHQH